jgi:hypothetical protein
MSDASSPDQSIGPADLRAMLRIAGLAIPDERVPVVLAEINSQRAFARLIDPVLEDAPESGFAAYDPSWSSRDHDEASR